MAGGVEEVQDWLFNGKPNLSAYEDALNEDDEVVPGQYCLDALNENDEVVPGQYCL